MSSFVCDPKHFNTVEDTLQTIFLGSNCSMISYRFYQYLQCRTSGIDAIRDKITSFMDTLRDLQAVCVTLQYRHHYEGRVDEEIQSSREILSNKRVKGERLSLPALVKALICINYQIEPLHLTELRQLTEEESSALQIIRDLINDINQYIVTHLPEYENAKWSIE